MSYGTTPYAGGAYALNTQPPGPQPVFTVSMAPQGWTVKLLDRGE